MRVLVPLALLLMTIPAAAEDLSKATKGLILRSDCSEDICHSYRLTVSQKFVRLPIARQLTIVRDFCHKLDAMADDYQDEDGHDWTIDSCVFAYRGLDIAYQTNDGRAEAEPAYVAALAALRDAR